MEPISFGQLGAPPLDKVTVLRHKIGEYQKDWELMEIGTPDNNDRIPLIFRKKGKDIMLNITE